MAGKKKNTVRLVLFRLLALILLLIGLALIFNKQIRNQMINHNQNQTMTTLSRQKIEESRKQKGMFNFAKVQEIDFGQVARAARKNNAHAIGALAIPDVNMRLPILLGMSNDAMATGGGTMRPDQKMGQGNYPLAGHYMTAKGILFSPLQDTKIGELVYLTDLKKVYVYRIYMKKIVNPRAVYLVNNTKKAIVTLITCADGGANRWAVRGHLVKIEQASNSNLRVFNLKQ